MVPKPNVSFTEKGTWNVTTQVLRQPFIIEHLYSSPILTTDNVYDTGRSIAINLIISIYIYIFEFVFIYKLNLIGIIDLEN